MSLKDIAKETLKIIGEGRLVTSKGKIIDFSSRQRAAEEGTVLYTPQGLKKLMNTSGKGGGAGLHIEVTPETTQEAAYRLAVQEGVTDPVLLNFASAKNPGGGFINGAKAQEEDLSRCSGLYPCLLKQPGYYDANNRNRSFLYTDHIIYSPGVPWFRVKSSGLLGEVFFASVITAPAPNAGQYMGHQQGGWPEIEEALHQRAGYVLAVARDRGHRCLLLGAWGCGVFRNNADMVANSFGAWLESPQFAGAFDRVVFGIYDSSKNQDTLKAFQGRFKK